MMKMFNFNKKIENLEVSSNNRINVAQSSSGLLDEGLREKNIKIIKKSLVKDSSYNSFTEKNSLNPINEDSFESDSSFVIFENMKKNNRKHLYLENRIEIDELERTKNKLITLLYDDNSMTGFTTQTEKYIESMYEINKPVIQSALFDTIRKVFNNSELLTKLVESVSNLDYYAYTPDNFSLVQIAMSNTSLEVQEAVIAAYEKWGDPNNIPYLENSHYNNDMLKEYALEVKEYLEGI